MTKQEFGAGIEIIETFTGKQFTDRQTELYYELLKNLSKEQFENGLMNMFKKRVYSNLPQPAEILDYCLERKKEDINSRCLKAKSLFRKLITVHGSYGDYVLPDPVLHKLIKDNGGLLHFTDMLIVDFENFLKFEFDKLYQSYLSRDNLGSIPVIIHGRHSLSNQSNGQEHKPNITYLEDAETCKRWQLEYFKKNPHDNLNFNNYHMIGFTDKPKLGYSSELTSLELSNGKEFVEEILTEVQETRESKPKSFKIEYTQNELKAKMERYIKENKK